jgi:hypothetical protein
LGATSARLADKRIVLEDNNASTDLDAKPSDVVHLETMINALNKRADKSGLLACGQSVWNAYPARQLRDVAGGAEGQNVSVSATGSCPSADIGWKEARYEI